MVQSDCGNYRNAYEQGAALLVAMVTLMVIAFGAIHITAEQVLAQHQMLSLEFRRLERQNVTEELFESMALGPGSTSDGVEWTRSMMDSPESNNQLSAVRQPIDCPHPFATTSRCAQLRVQQAGTGFLRERVLVEPVPHCSKSYWYAPDFRVGHTGMPPRPPGDPVWPTKPERPPGRLPNRP